MRTYGRSFRRLFVKRTSLLQATTARTYYEHVTMVAIVCIYFQWLSLFFFSFETLQPTNQRGASTPPDPLFDLVQQKSCCCIVQSYCTLFLRDPALVGS